MVKSFVGLIAVAALVAGCGGSGGGSSTQGVAQASSVSAVAAPASTPQPTFASTSNCQQLADMGAKYVHEIESAGSGGQLDLATAIRAMQAMADASPSAIHGDAEYAVHWYAGFVGSLAKVGFKPGTTPSASQMAALVPLLGELNAPRFHAAVDHINAWIHANCHGVTP